MKKRSHKSPAPKTVAAPTAPFAVRLERLWLVWLTALLVATPLLPSDSSSQGTGIVLVMLWLVLLVTWSTAKVLRKDATMFAGGVAKQNEFVTTFAKDHEKGEETTKNVEPGREVA